MTQGVKGDIEKRHRLDMRVSAATKWLVKRLAEVEHRSITQVVELAIAERAVRLGVIQRKGVGDAS